MNEQKRVFIGTPSGLLAAALLLADRAAATDHVIELKRPLVEPERVKANFAPRPADTAVWTGKPRSRRASR